MTDEEWQAPWVRLTVDLVILTLRDESLHLLVIERGVEPYAGMMALPGGFLRDEAEPIAEAARRELAEEAGLDADALYLEESGVYGDPGRDPRGRVVSVAHLAIMPRLPDPVAGTDAADARWVPADDVLTGRLGLAFDHQRIVADGVERARRKLEHSSLATAFCGPAFTIAELQRVYEAVWGIPLDPRNFYRKIQGTRDFVIPAGASTKAAARKKSVGRPARLFRAGPSPVLNPPMTRPADHPSSAERTVMNDTIIVILVAMNVEYSAVRSWMSGITVRTHPMGTRFEVGHLDNDDGCRVALALVGKGNQSAAVLTERAVAQFGPVAVIFTGVAGALQPHLSLGDVVVATHVYAYHGATSEDDGTTARPRTWELAHNAHQIAAHVDRVGDWARDLPGKTRVHFGPVAAGEIAHYSATSDARQWLREHYNDAVAVEMEAAGVAQAGHLNDAIPAIMVRGISDYADATKTETDGEGWQPRAVNNAAAFAVTLAAALAAELNAPSGPTGGDQRGGGPFNLATGNARVGLQGQNVTIHGGIQLGGPDQGNGTLATIDKPKVHPGKLKLILNGSRRLLSDLANLAASVTAVITVIRSAT